VARKDLLPAGETKSESAGQLSGVGTTQRAATDPKKNAKPEVTPQWKRQLEFGYVQQSGAKDKQDLVMRGQLDGREGAHTFRAIGRLLRSEANGKTVTDRNEGNLRWRFDINKRLFTQALTTYEEDDVRKIDLNLEQQIGGGYRIIDSERHQANVGLGVGMQYLQRQTISGETALLGSVFQDYTYQLTTRLKLVQEASVLLSDRGTLNLKSGTTSTSTDGSYRLKFNTGLQSKVTEHMSLNVRFEYDYDRSVLESDLRADQRLTTALGYLW
jgi:putative salt-induced outer membrane protein YdiY